MSTADDEFGRLEAGYCPPLDPALLSAILSDYDLDSQSNVQEARAALDQLKDSALLEEQLGFDASGTGGKGDGLPLNRRPESFPDETTTSISRDTDLTSLSAGLSSLDLDTRPEYDSTVAGNSDIAEELESLDEDTKIQLLQQMLEKRVSRYTVQHTLRKTNGKFHVALEELLSHVYFNEAENSEDGEKFSAKSVDAFSEDNTARRGRKGKGKSKKRNWQALDERRSSSLPASPVDGTSNAWQGSSQDIEFITSRTTLSRTTVASIYYKSGASLSKTIGGLLKAHLNEGAAAIAEDPIKAVNAHDLGSDFPKIAPNFIASLVNLTYPSTAAARELAAALTAPPKTATGGIQIIPQYAPPVLDDSEPEIISKKPISRTGSPTDTTDARERASAYAAARNAALAQAYAAHRKAKSDRLMGGAAAYYGQVSRDLYALSSHASAAAADQLATSQSSATSVDLHGIDVLNAVRIAQERTEAWWDSLGENRVNGRIGAQERHTAFRIIVGQGRHSAGGRSKLGPAISKMLRETGWKFEQEGPAILVQGKARR